MSDLLKELGLNNFELAKDKKEVRQNRKRIINEGRIVAQLPFNYKTKKSDELIKFFNRNDDLPKQGTKEWLKARLKHIGGSEISSVTGNNPYSNKQKLIKAKAGITPYKKNHFMLWGTMFEDVLRRTVEIIEDLYILETGSIVGDYGQAYSPDGVCYDPIEDKTILYEFKCPLTRIQGDKIPIHYKDQVLLGLDTIDICEEGRYIEAMIRRCPLLDVGFTNYYTADLSKSGFIDFGDAIATGIIGIYSFTPYDYNIMDYGESDPKYFLSMMYNIINGTYNYYIQEPIVNPKLAKQKNDISLFKQLNSFDKFCERNKVYKVGIIPYKIFPFKVHLVEHQKDFAKNLEEDMKYVIEEVAKLNKDN